MAFLLYPPGSRELDLLQTAVLNVGQHSTRFGGERPSKSARSGLSGLRLSARRLAGALSARRLAGALSAQRFAPCQHASGLKALASQHFGFSLSGFALPRTTKRRSGK